MSPLKYTHIKINMYIFSNDILFYLYEIVPFCLCVKNMCAMSNEGKEHIRCHRKGGQRHSYEPHMSARL